MKCETHQIFLANAISDLVVAQKYVIGGDISAMAGTVCKVIETLSKLDGVRHRSNTDETYAVYKSEVPEGHNTVLGYIAENNPEMLELISDPAEGTQRDGFKLSHWVRGYGIDPIKVDAPSILRIKGIEKVNAYPEHLLKDRFGF